MAEQQKQEETLTIDEIKENIEKYGMPKIRLSTRKGCVIAYPDSVEVNNGYLDFFKGERLVAYTSSNPEIVIIDYLDNTKAAYEIGDLILSWPKEGI
ncbi:hypothetical protein OXPF_39710 [Oxobacter pfennigii]|uniref:Uncharacterized protein n=1 Tax=Oxobacter pfennigii TaxID=36849 RepID=A0A0N8NSJ3_9CLOT|nr:hypothetical protein [Oxobacter pfennigii]KPU42192.1 hypothetical protein OXPF_39710 [Oxobacter pfennigii]